MFETLKRLYDEGKISDTQLDVAVNKGWIAQEQAEEIKAVG